MKNFFLKIRLFQEKYVSLPPKLGWKMCVCLTRGEVTQISKGQRTTFRNIRNELFVI